MKTIEEKAKAYDEALEKAKELLDSPRTCFDIVQLESIFHELRESEDEKIYNEIMEFFKMNEKRCIVDNSYTRWIVWFEKQKEQNPPTNCKHLHTYTDDLTKEDVEKTIFDVCVSKKQKSCGCVNVESEYDKGWRDGHKAGLKDAEMQKPVEWSEEDEEWYMLAKESVLERWKNTDNPILIELRDGTVKWLRELAGRIYQEQEWSEEDERIRQGLIEMYKNEHLVSVPIGIHSKDIIRFLENLRPSWKPSEEDIKMLEHIIGQYETGNKNSNVMGYLPRVEELNFLKKVLAKWKN